MTLEVGFLTCYCKRTKNHIYETNLLKEIRMNGLMVMVVQDKSNFLSK
jgi:hypothetical protein